MDPELLVWEASCCPPHPALKPSRHHGIAPAFDNSPPTLSSALGICRLAPDLVLGGCSMVGEGFVGFTLPFPPTQTILGAFCPTITVNCLLEERSYASHAGDEPPPLASIISSLCL